MKKMVSLLLAVALLLCAFAHAEENENWYLQIARKLAERMGTLAGDEVYMRMFTTQEEVLSMAAEVGKADFSRPESARLLSLGGTNVALSLLQLFDGQDFSGLSAEAKEKINRGIPGMIASVLNARTGVNQIALASMLNVSETFVAPEGFVPCIIFLSYPGDHAVLASFSMSGEETLTASAQLVAAEAIEDMLEKLPAFASGMLNALLTDLPVE